MLLSEHLYFLITLSLLTLSEVAGLLLLVAGLLLLVAGLLLLVAGLLLLVAGLLPAAPVAGRLMPVTSIENAIN